MTSAWTAQRREAYANDLGATTSLVGVTARSNRGKSEGLRYLDAACR
ncbi:hypothetical protein J7I98_39410 [Streptomyces sp. ISL-98]|nr:hypothetical protein [Streptomyces sp. ISL-98]MBT2511738.1 hypothetical protein [Streptomyces sp. ISL-98]